MTRAVAERVRVPQRNAVIFGKKKLQLHRMNLNSDLGSVLELLAMPGGLSSSLRSQAGLSFSYFSRSQVLQNA